MATNQLSTPVVDNDGEPRRRILRGLQDDVEDAPPELRDEVSELLFEGNYDDDEALLVRGDHSSILVPKCDNCLIYQNMCVTLMGSTSAMSEELRKLEKLEPACERFKKQLAESQIQIEESLQSEQVLKTRVATAEAEAAEAKEKYASLERDYDAMAKAAEEGKKHAHEANTWRVKYERTVEVSKKIQDKRKEDMAKFDKVLNLANGYCKEAVSLKENYKKVIGHLEKLAYAVQTYVPTVFELLKEAVSLPSFKTEAPAHLQVEAERLCSIDVKQAFKVGLDSLNLRLDSRSVMDDDDGMSLEVERLMGNFDASSLSPRPSASKKRAVGRRPTEAMLRKQRATPSPMVLPADRSKAQAEHSEPPSVQPQEPGADVDPVVPPQELVEPDAVLMDDEEADKLLELGAEAISMPTPRSARTASARGRGRGRGKKGAAARSSRDLAAPVSSANPEQIRKQYEEALASKLRRRDTTAEERPSTSAEVKHMSIHGKKMMSIREQQEAQMKVSIKDKVAMMKKKEEAERIRTLEDSDDERDSPSPEIGSEPVPKRTEKVSPTKSAMAGFSLAREDLLLSASPSPGTSVIEGEGGGADEEVEPSDVQPPAEQPTQEASAQEGNEDGSMDVESRPVDSTPKISQDGSSVSLELLEDLAMEGEVPFGCTGMEEVHFDKQVEDVAQSPESEPETEQEKEPEPLPEQENEPEPEPVSDLDIRHEEEVAVDQPAEEQLSAEDDQQMDDTPAVDMVEKIPSAENTDAVVDESALLPALVESSEAALASVDDMGETAGLQIDDGLPEEEAAVESGPGKEVVEEADAAPTAPTAMEIGNDEQAPELREEVPASASKEPELSGPVEEQCPVQEGAGEQAAEVVVSESSEPCSSSPIAKPKLAEDTKRALGFGRRLRVDLGDKLEPISGTPSPQGAEKRKSVDEGERISTDAQSSEGQEAMPSADVPATDRDLAMQLHAQLNPRSLRSRRDSEPSQVIQIHIQHTLQPSGSKPVPAKQHGKAKESQQGIGETKQNENTQRPSGPKQTPTKQLGKTKEPQQQAVEAKQNESESGMDLFNDILAGARNVTSKEKEDGGKKAAMTKRILPVKKECPGAKWQPEKVLEKEEVSKSVAPSSAVESVKLPVSNNDTPVEPTPVSGDTRAPSAAESSEALESTSLPTPRRTTRSCVAEHPRQSHVSSTPSRKPAAKPVEPVTPKEGAAETKSKSESAKKTTVTSSLPQKTPTAPKRESVLSPVRQTRARAEKAESTTDSTSSGPPSRVTSRTGPVAPKKRRVEQETVSEEEPTSSIAAPTSSLEDSDDEERLCVVEEGEIVEKEKAQDEQPQAHVDDDEEERLIVVESDEEDRLVLDDGQDSEEETSVVTRSKAGASVEAAVEKSKAEKPTKSKSGGTTAATTTLRTLPERSACVSTRRAHSTEDNAHVSTKASASRQTPRNVGALEAAKRSVSDFKAGPAAMEKFNATLSKQLRGRGRPPKNAPMPMRASSKGEEASRASASGETPPAPKKVEQKASAAATPQRTPSTSTRQSKMLQEAPPDTPSSRGVKRSAGVSAEAVHPVKRPQPGDSSVDRLLSGALMSEQKIEVIRKSLGERLNEIAQLSPHVFASVMLTISRSLPSGDLWTIVQMNFRNCDSSDIHNTREEKFLQNCRDLGCGERIWLEYVKRLAVMIATQDPNPLHTGRYFRLLIRALHYTGSLLSPAEKKAYLRPVLTKVFKTDMNVAVKATIYILLSPYYELLEWMKDANDPVSMLISIAIMTSQMDGKVLIWAWFQQFSEELPLHEVSPVTVRKAFDELVTKLDKLAVKRSTAMKQVPPSDEELEVISMAVAYLSPGNGQPVELRQILVQLVTDCLKRVKHALNPRALGGEKAWSEAYMVHNRLDLFIGLSVAAVLRKDDMTLQHDVRDLLQNETPSIREVASEVKKTTSSERPWLNIYQIAMTNAVQILKLFTQYEI